MGFVDPRVKVTILLVATEELEGRSKVSIHGSVLNAAQRCNKESVPDHARGLATQAGIDSKASESLVGHLSAHSVELLHLPRRGVFRWFKPDLSGSLTRENAQQCGAAS